jgi:nitroreductase
MDHRGGNLKQAQLQREDGVDLPRDMAEIFTTRRSVRAFLPTPVSREQVENILELAARAPSGTNTQPWRVYVVAGEPLARLKARLRAAHDDPSIPIAREYEHSPGQWFEPYLSRRRKVGWDLYGLLGISRGERERIHEQHGRNYDLFGAPVGIFCSVDRRLEKGSWMDCGMFIQSIMLAARIHGLHTCPQAALTNYPSILLEELGIPEEEIALCGIALGYEDKSAVENGLRTERELVEDFATFMGL